MADTASIRDRTAKTPYAVVQVEIEEGPRLTANLDVPPGGMRVGLAATVVFDDVTGEVALSRSRRVP